jgi:hypothetical protein
MLFHVLNDYSTTLWKQQTDLIMEKHGLMSFIVHPDYIIEDREKAVYEALLANLSELREKREVWITTPGEVNRWWRQRAAMSLVEDGDNLRIEGIGNERARVAYASEEDGRLVFTFHSRNDDQEISQGSQSSNGQSVRHGGPPTAGGKTRSVHTMDKVPHS